MGGGGGGGELLKGYLNRLWALTVRLQTHDEDVMVIAFGKGIAARPFNNSVIRNPAETFSEIRRRAVTHINAEEAVATKSGSSCSRQPKPKESSQASQPLRVNETSTEKKMDSRYAPYACRKNEPKTKAREELEFRPKFRVSYKELLGMPGVVNKMKFPQKSDRNNLGPRKDVWCEFHKGFGHDVEWCIAVGYQLVSL